MERDPEAASAEYIAQFLSDLGKIILRKVVDAAVCTSPLELPFAKYAGSWPGDEFKKHNIDYTSSEKPKSGCIWTCSLPLTSTVKAPYGGYYGLLQYYSSNSSDSAIAGVLISLFFSKR